MRSNWQALCILLLLIVVVACCYCCFFSRYFVGAAVAAVVADVVIFFPYTLNQNEKHSTWYSVKRNGIELYFYGLHYTGKSVWFELLIALALFICTKTMEPFPNAMWINFYWVKISLASTQSRWKQLFVWCCLVCAVASFEARARERVHQHKMRFILFVISRCFFLSFFRIKQGPIIFITRITVCTQTSHQPASDSNKNHIDFI